MKKLHSLLLLAILLLAGCSSLETQNIGYTITPDESNTGSSLGLDAFVEENLLAQYNEWKGTPYQYNGLSSQGVDCSGFMYITFKSQFGIEMPRSTDEQVRLGKTIEKSELRSGDLVFFKTGLRTRHVGVYLSDSHFLHASTKRGVMISSLEDDYWKSSYWLSKRILN